jgi:hypothetical protein
MSEWQDCGLYWLHLHPQRSPAWHQERGKRLTSSLFSAIANPTFIKGPEDIISHYSGKKKEKRSFQQRLAMYHGNKREPLVRDWYKKTYEVDVSEIGLAIPKWDTRLGSSVDGDVTGTRGIIEIKATRSLYRGLKEYLEKTEAGWEVPKYYHEHILDTHYDQIQGSMAILDKDWCDYIVSTPDKNFVFRVEFNPEYWREYLYPALKIFLDTHSNLFQNHTIST